MAAVGMQHGGDRRAVRRRWVSERWSFWRAVAAARQESQVSGGVGRREREEKS
jgi:hypothetical protein